MLIQRIYTQVNCPYGKWAVLSVDLKTGAYLGVSFGETKREAQQRAKQFGR
jgi:hypothetical protein